MKVWGWSMIALACACGVSLVIDPGEPVSLAVLIIGVVSSLGLAVLGGALVSAPSDHKSPKP